MEEITGQEKKSQITLICCYNDEKQLERLKGSLAEQDCTFELVLIDNRKNTFSSAAAALNSALPGVRTAYVAFCHQDVILPDASLLARFVSFLSKIQTGDVLGVAGGMQGSDVLLTSIWTDEKRTPVPGSRPVRGLEHCDIVDECFFGGRTETFAERGFDALLCPGFHLYAAERCLYALENRHQVYVCDLPLIHASRGTISADYNTTFLALSKRYAKVVSYLRTTCCYAPTTWPLRNAAYWYRKCKLQLGLYGKQ